VYIRNYADLLRCRYRSPYPCFRHFLHLLIYVVLMADSQSSCISDGTSLTSSLLAPSTLTHAPHLLVWREKHWRRIPHISNKRRGTGESPIWDWGHEYVDVEDDKTRAWRCGRCVKDYLAITSLNGTGNARAHLKGKHQMSDIETFKIPKRPEDNSNQAHQSLVQVVKINDFWYHLTRWIVENHLPFIVVEDDNFRAMLRSLNCNVDKQIIRTGDTIRNWVQDEFVTAQNLIQTEVLDRAISKIHISCDIWSSPNEYAFCGIAAHFVSHEGKLQSVLLGLRRLQEAHRGEQIAEHLINVIKQYGFAHRLGVFVGDNVDSNDVAWKETLRCLAPHRDSVTSRSRCLGHIINLAAKAFIFGKSVSAFEAVVDSVDEANPRESDALRIAQQEWRQKGPVGKLHNIIIFVRASVQRQEEFKQTTIDGCNNSKYIFR
jgi:hypothetical protein